MSGKEADDSNDITLRWKIVEELIKKAHYTTMA